MTIQTKPKRKSEYLNNRDLLAEVIKSKSKGEMTNDLAKMLQLLTSKYAKRGNFASYTYNEDMQGYAMLMLVKTWDSFNPEKSENPFAFFTQCIKNSFIQYLNYERRQRDIRDEILVDVGMTPSYNYQMEYEEEEEGFATFTPSSLSSYNEERVVSVETLDTNLDIPDDLPVTNTDEELEV